MRRAYGLILLLGVVSLFADVTYEGARSILGPFLAQLGAGAVAVGITSGVAEFLGYAMRLLSGQLADRTRRYWVLTFLGYAVNLLAVPALAFTGSWEVAALLIVVERIGKGIRTPARDALLSVAAERVGRGKGFGIHETLDQVGAVLGPLLLSGVILLKRSYREALLLLFIPALMAMGVLTFAMLRHRSVMEGYESEAIETDKELPPAFWLYTLFTLTSVLGLVNFMLISYHFELTGFVRKAEIPALYALAMAVDAAVAMPAGMLYDRLGLRSLILLPAAFSFIPVFAFSGSRGSAVAASLLYGVALGMQETVMRAGVAEISPLSRRGTAYGIFNTAYGLAWLLGSALMGALYTLSPSLIIAFVLLAEVLSVPLLLAAAKKAEK